MEVCRACLCTRKDIDLLPITAEFITNYNLLTNLNISSSDSMPQTSCKGCFENISKFMKFRAKCISTEVALQDMIANDVKIEVDLPIKSELAEDVNDIKEEKDEPKYIECLEHEMDSSFLDCLQDTLDLGLQKQEETYLSDSNSLYKFKKRKSNRVKLSRTNIEKKEKANDNCGMKVPKIFTCGLCPKVVEDKDLLIAHLESHKNATTCDMCNDILLDWPYLLGHRLKHIPISEQACPMCWKRYKSGSYLEHHIRNVHCSNEFQGLRCNYCQRSYDTPRKLKRHIRYIHSDDGGVCLTCFKRCKSKQLLKQHMQVHTNHDNKFVCDTCGYSCKYPGTLKTHTIRKHATNKIECKVCWRIFASENSKSKHTCMQSVMCTYCGKEFKKIQSYRKHLKSHSSEYNYKCDRCPAKYKSNEALKVHLNRHDGVRTKECEYCHAKFYSAAVLIKHRRVHTGEKPYVCKICEKAFTGGHNLKVHMKVHGLDLVVKKNNEPVLDMLTSK